MSDTAEQPGLIDRTLSRLGRAFRDVADSARVALTGVYRPDLPEDDLLRLDRQIALCLDPKAGEVTSRGRAAELGRIYLSLAPEGRARFLAHLAGRYGPDETAIERAIEAWRQAEGAAARARAAAGLRKALVAPRESLLRQFNALPQGIKFLVDLRAELLHFQRQDPALQILDDDLLRLLAGWFDIGFLDLREIGWNAPASLLEKLIAYEAVHRIQSWDDLKNRLDSDRRCFAFFHPRMPDEPLIFVEVALVQGMSGSIQALLDQEMPALSTEEADSAIFYSISNCQRGLAGVSFGNFLIKRVVDLISREQPRIKTFATLSPIPGFRDWLDQALATEGDGLLRGEEADSIVEVAGGGEPAAALRSLLERDDWPGDPAADAALRGPLMRLCAFYLLNQKRDGKALDRVAHFHLSNGARVERINWQGDSSINGLRQSAGMMVNYLYKLDEIEQNHEAYATEGRVAASAAVRRLRRL
ncbi:MAG: malonyl-CoA decarboxylase family protein [Alphaproteobacteria bacterium]|nr:malonyl-CoA decarboxylase family protein [Alphaproteobacteria bacterium]